VIPADEHPTKDQTPLTTVGTDPAARTPYHKASGGEDVEIVVETRTSVAPLPDEVIDAAASRHAETVRQSIFATTAVADDWDYEAEKAQRTSTEPYIIHADEFAADEMDFVQLTCTYYEKDDVLATDHDNEPFNNYPRVVGELRFGHGSNDPNVVYIRNETSKTEYEIMLDKGSWEEETQGIFEEQQQTRAELKHERSRRFPRE